MMWCLYDCSDNEAQCEAMDRLVQELAGDDDEYDESFIDPMAKCLCHVLQKHFKQPLYPQGHADEE